jgi:Tfp pilus assembly protein PilX
VSRRTSTSSRCRGDQGSGLVTGIVLIFAFTFLGLVWLARDVDRGISNRSAAQSIAFQAARSGAQQSNIGEVRGDAEAATVDPAAARSAATRTAEALFDSYDVDGAVTSIEIVDNVVSVSVRIVDGGITVTGAATVRAERAP